MKSSLFYEYESRQPEWYAESRESCGHVEFDDCPARRLADGLCIASPISCFYPCCFEKNGPWTKSVEEHRHRERIASDPDALAHADGRLF